MTADSPRWSKHYDWRRTPEHIADMEAADPTTDVDVLTKAAEDLRHPMLCNWDPAVAHALADAMEKVARAIRMNGDMVHRVGYGELVETARAFMARMVIR